MKAIITVGIPASGKTTWAKALCKKDNSYINLNRDDLRVALFGYNDTSEYKYKKNRENVITQMQLAMAVEASKQGKNIIVSDTNLNLDRREKLTEELMKLGYDVEVEVFEVTFEEAMKRDVKRACGVGSTVIYSMLEKYNQQFGYTYVGNPNMPEAIIFDLDGTLADMRGIRGPFDWAKVGEDAVHVAVKAMLDGYVSEGYEIVLLSGRDSVCEEQTREWLIEHDIWFDGLFMRGMGDSRKDTIIKRELFDTHVKGTWSVVACVDDRPTVCRLWQSMGLKVINVGNPWKEF